MRRHFVLAASVLVSAGCAAKAPQAIPSSPQAKIAIAEDTRDLTTLLTFIHDEDPAVRARAAQALGRCGNPEALGALRSLALDSDAAVRVEAIFAWGLLGGAGLDDAATVKEVFDGADGAGKQALAFALGNAGKPAAAKLLFAQFSAVNDPEVLGAAALASSKYLTDRFKSDDAAFQEAAEAWITTLGDAGRGQAFVKVRWKLAYALASTPRLASSDQLVTFATDTDPLTRLFAARGLAKRPDTSAWGADDAVKAYVRQGGASLAEVQDRSRKIRDLLTRLAEDSDARVACEVAIAVKAPGRRELFSAFAADLDRPQVFLRRAAVRALGRGNASQYLDVVLPALEKASRDANPWVRAECSIANAGLGTADSIAAVERAARDADPFVRARAAEAAAAIPPAKALTLLAACAKDLDPRVAAAAAASLGKLEGREAEPLLRPLLSNASGLVRETAAESIQARCQHSSDILADSTALLESLTNSVGPEFSEPRSTILVALTEVESSRRAGSRSIHVPGEPEFRLRVRNAILDNLTDPDPAVRAKAILAWKSIEKDDPVPEVKVRPSPPPAIPGVNAPAFTREPKVKLLTNRGEFVISLFHLDAPIHANNFLLLTTSQAYDGTPWHRVEFNFVVQGGDPLGNGTGGATSWGGSIRDEINRSPFLRGTVGMPKTDVPDTGGSQLFVSLIPTPHLDGRYTAFGQVIEGIEVLDLLEVGDRIEHAEIVDRGRD